MKVKEKRAVPRVPGMRLAASYVNHLICNGGVIAPALDVPGSDARCIHSDVILADACWALGAPAQPGLVFGPLHVTCSAPSRHPLPPFQGR